MRTVPLAPLFSDIPSNISAIPNNCGLVAIWYVCRKLHVRWSLRRAIKKSRYSSVDGIQALGVALALATFGLRVTYASRPDPDITPVELALLEEGKHLGVKVTSELPLEYLLAEAKEETAVPIVLYEREGEELHFSTLWTMVDEKVFLNLDNHTLLMPRDDFLMAWSRPGVNRQAILVSVPVDQERKVSR